MFRTSIHFTHLGEWRAHLRPSALVCAAALACSSSPQSSGHAGADIHAIPSAEGDPSERLRDTQLATTLVTNYGIDPDDIPRLTDIVDASGHVAPVSMPQPNEYFTIPYELAATGMPFGVVLRDLARTNATEVDEELFVEDRNQRVVGEVTFKLTNSTVAAEQNQGTCPANAAGPPPTSSCPSETFRLQIAYAFNRVVQTFDLAFDSLGNIILAATNHRMNDYFTTFVAWINAVLGARQSQFKSSAGTEAGPVAFCYQDLLAVFAALAITPTQSCKSGVAPSSCEQALHAVALAAASTAFAKCQIGLPNQAALQCSPNTCYLTGAACSGDNVKKLNTPTAPVAGALTPQQFCFFQGGKSFCSPSLECVANPANP